MKTCIKCKKEKSLSEFYFRKDSNKYRNECKKCNLESNINWRIRNKEMYEEYHKSYRENNYEKILHSSKNYYLKNKNIINKKKRESYPQRRDKFLKYLSSWREKNRDYIKIKTAERYKNPDFLKKKIEYNNKRQKYLRKNYPEFKIKANISRHINRYVNKEMSTNKYLMDFGYSIFELKLHLEKQFDKNMNWGNYGRGKSCWNIDHIRPQSSFDFTDKEQLKDCWSLANLRPCWSTENSSKGNSIDFLV